MTETEIERMVVRLRGDNSHYKSMFDSSVEIAKNFGAAFERVSKGVVNSLATVKDAVASTIHGIGQQVRSFGSGVSGAGGLLSALGNLGSSELNSAAASYGVLGSSIKSIAKEFKITREEASVFKFMSDATGISIQTLTKHVKSNSEEFAKWKKDALSAGLVVWYDLSEAAKEYMKSQERLKTATSGFWTTLGSIVAPSITKMNELITASIKIVTKWVNENKALIRTVLEVASALGIAGTALSVIGSAIGVVGGLITPFAALLASVAAGLAVVEYRTNTGATLWNAYADSFKKVWESAVAYIMPIAGFVEKSMQGIRNAILAGNPEMAIRILMTSIHVAWINGLEELNRLTQNAFGAIFHNLAAGNWQLAGEAAMNELKMAFNKGIISLEDVWTTFRVQLNQVYNDFMNFADGIYTEFNITANNLTTRWNQVYGFFSALIENLAKVWNFAISSTMSHPLVVHAQFTSKILGGVLSAVSSVAVSVAKLLGNVIAGTVSLGTTAIEKLWKMANLNRQFEKQAVEDSVAFLMGELNKAKGDMAALSNPAQGDPNDPFGHGKTGRMEQENRARARQAAMERANAEMIAATAERRIRLEAEIADLQKRQEELSRKGKQDAADALKFKQDMLFTDLEAAKAAEERARKARPEDIAITEEEIKKQEQFLKDGKSLMEKYMPAQEVFIKKWKNLQELFKSGALGPDGAKILAKEIKIIEDELKNASLKAVIKFDTEGLESVKIDSAEYRKLALQSLEAQQKGKLGNKALEDAQAAIKEEQRVKDALKDPMQGFVDKVNKNDPDAYEAEAFLSGFKKEKVGKAAQKEWENSPARRSSAKEEANAEKMRALLENIAKSTGEMAERDTINFEPAGIA